MCSPALIVMLFGLVMIINLGTGLAATQLAVEVVSGSLLGGCLGLAVVYLALLANNGGNTTITKVLIPSWNFLGNSRCAILILALQLLLGIACTPDATLCSPHAGINNIGAVWNWNVCPDAFQI